MNKKGFTLAEMLATVAVLGVVILIVAPNITGTLKKVNDDKYKRFLSDVFLATEAYIQANIDDYPGIANENERVYVYFSDLINTHYLKSDVYDPKNKTTVANEDYTVEVYLSDGEYKYKLYERHMIAGPTKKSNLPSETHYGIAYLNPTNLSTICDETNSVSTTETKTGCMKWYIFNDSGNNYTMILDHNTTARIKWNNSNSNVAYDLSNLKVVVDDLLTTSGWEVTPRLISPSEVNAITKKSEFDVSNTNSWYYFDTLTNARSTFSTTIRSNYDWLYNNSYNCKSDSTDYGCTIEDNSTYSNYGLTGSGQTYGYWTSAPVGTATSGSRVWIINRMGYLVTIDANIALYGIRPVITVPKSIFN